MVFAIVSICDEGKTIGSITCHLEGDWAHRDEHEQTTPSVSSPSV